MNRIVKSVPYVASLQITQQPGNMAPSVIKIEGYYEGGTQAWLQFFDSLGAPANATVPIYEESLGTVAPNGYSWQFNNPLLLNLNSALASINLTKGLIVCISTTQGALTIGTGSNFSSFYISLEEWEILPHQTVTQSGDTTTNVNALVTVWATGTFHTIDKIIVQNSVAAVAYLKLFAKTPVAGDFPLLNGEWQLSSSQALTELNFRGVGFVPESGSTTSAPQYNGCYIACETTQGSYNGAAFNNCTLQVNYI